jgi:putative ABC transport system permease protein
LPSVSADNISEMKATPGTEDEVLKMILRQGLTTVMIGLVPGLGVSLALGRVLTGRIHGLSSFEPGILMMVTFLLLSVTMTACYIPASRATKVDQMVALRYE